MNQSRCARNNNEAGPLRRARGAGAPHPPPPRPPPPAQGRGRRRRSCRRSLGGVGAEPARCGPGPPQGQKSQRHRGCSGSVIHKGTRISRARTLLSRMRRASPPHAPRAGFVTPPARNLSCSPARLCGVRGEAGAGGPRGDHAVRVWRWGRAGRGPRCSPRRGQKSHPKPRRARKRPPGPSVSSSCALTRSDHPGQVGLWADASPSVSFRS